MSASSRYGLYFARASCAGCGQQHIKRRLYRVIRKHVGACTRCGREVTYVKAWWSLYVQWMQNGACYVELNGSEP